MIQFATIVHELNSTIPIPVVTERDPVRPPCVIVRPGSPWLRHGVLCGPRQEGYELLVVGHPFDAKDTDWHLADLVDTVLSAVEDADLEWSETAAPTLINIGGTDYMSAVVNIATP